MRQGFAADQGCFYTEFWVQSDKVSGLAFARDPHRICSDEWGILVFRSLRNWAIVAALGSCLAPISQADAGEGMAAINSAVTQFVRQHLPASTRNSEIAVDVPAASVNFPTCTRLQLGYFGYANPFGNQTVAVHCQNPQVWTLYVPVQIRQGSKILIAAHSLSADSVLRASDLDEGVANSEELSGEPLHDPAQAIGQRLRYGVMAGQPILRSMLQQPDLVHAGQLVTLVAQGDGVRIATTAEAIENGKEGQSILVRNVQSGRVLHAIVTSNGSVRVSF
ncbi:flagellar basal body P-ring formation chaperone FlgA [Acidithiobacillus sp. AC3]